LQLNNAQQQAVTYTSGPLLVLAGAGSGKTRVITRKIGYLIEVCKLNARNILAVTFTNKAAHEMKDRIAGELKKEQRRGLTVTTFHSLGLEILRREYKTLNLKRGFSIFTESDSNLLLENIINENYASIKNLELEQVKHIIDNWKNNLINHTKAVQINPIVGAIYQDYQRLLTTYNAVDFNDLILLPIYLLQNHAQILHKWQNKFRYLLVDEYQDTNLSQYHLIKLLTHLQNQFTVVGDDAQSIYAWRGARPQNIEQLQQDYPNLKRIMLEQNYRSTATILKCANQLISNNPRLFAKNLWSQLGVGDKVKVVRCIDAHHECEYVVADIFNHHLRDNIDWHKFAILYRGNHQGKAIEQKLVRFNIPYKMYGATNFFERQEIKDVLSYLRLLINPDDDNAYLRIINVPRREIGQTTLEKLGLWANKRNISLLQASNEIGLSSILEHKACQKLQEFKEFIESIGKLLLTENPITAIKHMLASINMDEWLISNSHNIEIATKKIANVNTLIASLERMLADDKLDIVDAISKIVLRDVLERKQEQESNNQVQLMTLHAAKGLEFDYVYVICFEEEIIPHLNSIEAGNNHIEEERRLAYVGITRAKQNLTLTYAAKRKRYGEIVFCTPSRFIAELPSDNIEYIDKNSSKNTINKQHGNIHLASIYKTLGKEKEN